MTAAAPREVTEARLAAVACREDALSVWMTRRVEDER